MAQKVTVELEDDLDGSPADETLRFGFEGTGYEIDLSEKNARAFRAQLAPFVEHARKRGRGGPAQGLRGLRQAGNGVPRSGPGRKTRESRSAPAAGSRPA
jgi:hypothetical protein